MFRRLAIGFAILFVVVAFNTAPASAQQDPYPPTTVPVLGDRVERDPPPPVRTQRPLAFTGSDALPLARLGLVLLASGGLAVYAAKKRKDRQAAFLDT